MAESSYSNRSSVEPSSNASSPSSQSPADPPKKRTRASKPKVRTGCITCKIRRVKCDEGKPACHRCTSTGRTCDGYDKAALARYHSPGPTPTAELARAEFVRACEWNETLRSMRRIEADLDGTETERRLFARFRAATADGVATHLCNFTAFWSRLTPSAGCQDEAVKHAVVALATAYQLFQYPDEPSIDGFGRGDLEVFTIQQYNRSIERLQSHAGSPASESIRVTLVCCLAFISLETLRGNHNVAVAHLTNGLRILQSLPDATFDCLADGSMFDWPSNRDSLLMPDIIQLFAQFELSACFFTHGIQPVISERGYRTRRFDDGSGNGIFADVSHARTTMSCFKHDAIARLNEIAVVTAAGDESAAMFWSDPIQQRQQACLLARSTRLSALATEFFSPARFGTPNPATPELLGLSLDLLDFRCAQFVISGAAGHVSNGVVATNLSPFTTAFPPYHNAAAAPEPDHSLLPSILSLASRLATALASQSPYASHPTHTARTLTDVYTRLVGPLNLVATSTSDATTQAAAVRLLADNICRHQYQTATTGGGHPEPVTQEIVHLLERAVDGQKMKTQANGGRLGLSIEVPRALAGVGCLPPLWDALSGMFGTV